MTRNTKGQPIMALLKRTPVAPTAPDPHADYIRDLEANLAKAESAQESATEAVREAIRTAGGDPTDPKVVQAQATAAMARDRVEILKDALESAKRDQVKAQDRDAHDAEVARVRALAGDAEAQEKRAEQIRRHGATLLAAMAEYVAAARALSGAVPKPVRGPFRHDPLADLRLGLADLPNGALLFPTLAGSGGPQTNQPGLGRPAEQTVALKAHLADLENDR